MLSKVKNILVKFPVLKWLFHKIRYRTRRVYNQNWKLFKGKNGLEIGGPSKVFSNNGPLPLYNVIGSLDNVNFSSDNFWSTISEGKNFNYQDGKPTGIQIIADAINLSKIETESYDFLLSSHCIEHLANPLKGLQEWKRVIKPNGYIAIIAPDMRYTYDRKRPLTTFEHIKQDFINNTKENDTTHFDEVIKLHDLTNDGTVSNYEEHVTRTLNNFTTRIVHHHTFDIKLLKKMLEFTGFELIDTQVFRPYHLFAIAKKLN